MPPTLDPKIVITSSSAYPVPANPVETVTVYTVLDLTTSNLAPDPLTPVALVPCTCKNVSVLCVQLIPEFKRLHSASTDGSLSILSDRAT